MYECAYVRLELYEPMYLEELDGGEVCATEQRCREDKRIYGIAAARIYDQNLIYECALHITLHTNSIYDFKYEPGGA